jgi:hypothetical protein
MRYIAKTLICVTLFSIAMGFLETSVVVYLRQLYYPDNNLFPLALMNKTVIITELLREAATIIMLAGIGFLAGRKFITGFAWFLFSFAIWDIFYYIFLKLILNWPESLLTWDILFLIPTLWTGPVIAPVITSLTMILLALGIIYYDLKVEPGHEVVKLNKPEWFFLILGSGILIIGFTWDYSVYMFEQFRFFDLFSYSNKAKVISRSMAYMPRSFNWLIYIVAQLIILLGIGLFYIRNWKIKELHRVSQS